MINNTGINKFIHLGLCWIGDGCGGLERYQHGICSSHVNMGYFVEAWLQCRGMIDRSGPYSINAYASPNESRWIKTDRLKKLAIQRLPLQETVFVSHHASVSKTVLPFLRNMPHVIHFHGPWADESALEGAPKWKTWLQRRIERTAYHSADRIITLSDAFKRLVVERYGVDESRVHAIPGGIDSAAADPGVGRIEARERLGWPKDRPILLSVRRLVRRVGVDVLIDAVAELRDRRSDLLTLVGGKGPLKRELDQRIKDKGLEKRVRLLGFIPDQQLSLAYAAADYSIVPTQGLEGFGLVTIESMAAGTPSIVTPIGSLPEIVTPFCENLLLSGSGVNDIAEGLNQIIGGSSKVPDTDRCKRYVRENFDWSVIAPQVLAIYRSA
jgi:glycosyltransferase involved in cell wall biosynthesis